MRKQFDLAVHRINSAHGDGAVRDLPFYLKALSKNAWAILVFLAISLWLIGPRTHAGAFELARILVPSEARQLLFANAQREFAELDAGVILNPVSYPSIAEAAAAIPSSKVDQDALDVHILKSDLERHAVASHLASKYRISLAESQRYVNHAIEVAKEVNLDPALILAVMAIESSFNPNAQSHAGAQGLMQVLTRVPTEKFEPYGGVVAAFVPEANIRVGALILKACIAKAGSLEAGLRSYLGAPNASTGPNSYATKIIVEREELKGVARSRMTRNSNA
ncbi:MAG: transglycosylase SLT domain-containing protein [Polynucleobacter sp.]|nr:transglycosylase SLT domain-containing protein [Polynucleobacter sp.]